MLEQPLAAAKTVDEVIEVLVSGAEAVLETDPGFYVILYELFTAGRQNAEIKAELAELYQHNRERLADALRRKEAEGVLELRFDAEAIVTYMFAAADGGALQRLTDPDRDFAPAIDAGSRRTRLPDRRADRRQLSRGKIRCILHKARSDPCGRSLRRSIARRGSPPLGGELDPVAPRRLEGQVGARRQALGRLGVAVVDPHVPRRGVLEAPLDRHRLVR